MTEHNVWTQITTTLNALNDDTLSDLLFGSQQLYDGNYIIAAEPEIYSGLCHYFPLIETVVQDHSGKHFRLNLQQSVPMGTDADTLQIQPGAANISDAIINPERIVALPTYLLRFVPFVGAAPVLIAAALRQAFYFSSRDDGASQLYPKTGNEVTVDVQSILRMLGNSISRAKFFRIFKNGQMDWFVERAEPAHQFKDGQIRRMPNTYHYRGQMLTPGDADDLAAWFGQQDLAQEPAAVLTRALNSPRSQILTFPYRLPGDATQLGEARSVHQVVSQLLNSPRLDANLSGLCDQLSSHLIRPESFLALPWYWFTNVLPELGDDLGMLYLMSKNCCYIDWARGHDRNHFWVIGGLETLQSWIGSETLPKRIPHTNKSNRGRPRTKDIQPESQYTRDWRAANRQLASQYLVRTATRKTKTGTDWQLRVSEVQLTAQDETLRQALSSWLYALPAPVTTESLHVFATSSNLQKLMLIQSKAEPPRLCHFETLVNQGICQNETLTPAEICHFDTLADGLNSYFETLVDAGICQFDTILNILFKIKHTLTDHQYSCQQDTPDDHADLNAPGESLMKAVEGINDIDADRQIDLKEQLPPDQLWDFETLLSGANPNLKDRILASGLQAVFLSWLIEANLSAGVHSPLSLAISRTLQTRQPASLPARRLAALPAPALEDLLASVCQRLNAGQAGRFAFMGQGAADLSQLLQGVEDRATQLRLITRLRDSLLLPD
ncbi:MAG: hypothetical protein GX603_03745 [Chloroflexi bacterium]|nr:hypothetical protein [Chloroflexota bacterium]